MFRKIMLYFAHVNILYAYVKKVGFNQLILGKKKYALSLNHLSQHPVFDDISVKILCSLQRLIWVTPLCLMPNLRAL